MPPIKRRCTGRCQQLPGAFGPSALISAISVCRVCGQPEQREGAPARATTISPVAPQPVLYTIGYAGMRLDQFLQALLERQIEVLVDTRWNPAWSLHQGFDQATLRRAVHGHRVAYRHLPTLGTRPAWRHRFKEDGDWSALVAAYEEALAGQQDLLKRVAVYAQDHRICLLCMEHAPDHCHRSVLAQSLARLAGLQVEHLLAW